MPQQQTFDSKTELVVGANEAVDVIIDASSNAESPVIRYVTVPQSEVENLKDLEKLSDEELGRLGYAKVFRNCNSSVGKDGSLTVWPIMEGGKEGAPQVFKADGRVIHMRVVDAKISSTVKQEKVASGGVVEKTRSSCQCEKCKAKVYVDVIRKLGQSQIDEILKARNEALKEIYEEKQKIVVEMRLTFERAQQTMMIGAVLPLVMLLLSRILIVVSERYAK
ncbi:hypothetical protein CVT24_007852 [Panaeolus cyanescens]|uniref:Uncharacterized protein n=1 Tax=Panaeolus cyanescens TaxID=181874 RepID=A0A409VZF0_9AGAR|nr:hypothetical protein CVT24_007852 [Panaeolus cyanescens]